MDRVIGVASTSGDADPATAGNDLLFAPGERILVAVPADKYDFRSGSSLAAAHVSGVVALLLSWAPQQSAEAVRNILLRSQVTASENRTSVNACAALTLAGVTEACPAIPESSVRTGF